MKVFWTDFAIVELKNIYKYYKENAGIAIAKRIYQSILNRTHQLKIHPISGQIESNLIDLKQSHRYLVEGHVKIIYRIVDSSIFITDIFDTRQDPDKMMKTRSGR
jgi:toxin ParE1/3/4